MNTKSILLSMAALLLVGSAYTVYVFTQAPAKEVVADSQLDLVVSEQAFLELYIPHLEAAAAAAEVVLEKGTRLRPLHDIAVKIAEEKIVESEYLKGRYQELYGRPYLPAGVYTSQIRAIGELSASELERYFVEDMIRHHEVAIALAKKGLEISLSKEVAEVAQKSITRAEVEILSLREVQQLLPQE